jgi:hypothetical protein
VTGNVSDFSASSTDLRTNARVLNCALRQRPHPAHKYVLSRARSCPQCCDARSTYRSPLRYPYSLRLSRPGDGPSRGLWSRCTVKCQYQRSPARNAAGPESSDTDRARGRGSRHGQIIYYGLHNASRGSSVRSGVPRRQQYDSRQNATVGPGSNEDACRACGLCAQLRALKRTAAPPPDARFSIRTSCDVTIRCSILYAVGLVR